ncbi:hypothetical protein SAMN05216525_1197 [Bradyrhizobium sp. Gha]|nr:hypothetical protein SAMN05216525_1197 [Bradyrhizobium sp. Gha]
MKLCLSELQVRPRLPLLNQREEDRQGPRNGPWTSKAYLEDSNGDET